MRIAVIGYDATLPVVESLGYQGGRQARVVRLPDGSEAVAVAASARGPWRLWGADDRIGDVGIKAIVETDPATPDVPGWLPEATRRR